MTESYNLRSVVCLVGALRTTIPLEAPNLLAPQILQSSAAYRNGRFEVDSEGVLVRGRVLQINASLADGRDITILFSRFYTPNNSEHHKMYDDLVRSHFRRQ